MDGKTRRGDESDGCKQLSTPRTGRPRTPGQRRQLRTPGSWRPSTPSREKQPRMSGSWRLVREGSRERPTCGDRVRPVKGGSRERPARDNRVHSKKASEKDAWPWLRFRERHPEPRPIPRNSARSPIYIRTSPPPNARAILQAIGTQKHTRRGENSDKRE